MISEQSLVSLSMTQAVSMVSMSTCIQARKEKEANCIAIYAPSFTLYCWHNSLSFLRSWRKRKIWNFKRSDI